MAKSVVLLHGIIANAYMFEPMMDYFRYRSDLKFYPLNFYDNRPFSIAEWGRRRDDHIEWVMGQNPKDEIILLGHSFGGLKAVRACEKFGGRISKLILLAPAAPKGESFLTFRHVLRFLKLFHKFIFKMPIVIKDFDAFDSEYEIKIPDTHYSWEHTQVIWDIMSKTPEIKWETLKKVPEKILVSGEKDLLVPAKLAKVYVEKGGFKHFLLPNIGHSVVQSEECFRIIKGLI